MKATETLTINVEQRKEDLELDLADAMIGLDDKLDHIKASQLISVDATIDALDSLMQYVQEKVVSLTKANESYKAMKEALASIKR